MTRARIDSQTTAPSRMVRAALSHAAHQPRSTHHALMRRALPTNGVFANFRKKIRLLETLSPPAHCSRTLAKRMKASHERRCIVSPVQYDNESRIFLFSARVRVAQRRLRETNAPTNVKNATFWQKTRLLADADRVAQQDVCEQRINRLSSASEKTAKERRSHRLRQTPFRTETRASSTFVEKQCQWISYAPTASAAIKTTRTRNKSSAPYCKSDEANFTKIAKRYLVPTLPSFANGILVTVLNSKRFT